MVNKGIKEIELKLIRNSYAYKLGQIELLKEFVDDYRQGNDTEDICLKFIDRF